MQAALESDNPHIAWLVYIKAKNRATGLYEELGVHTGLDRLTVNIDSTSRDYEGVGSVINIPTIKFSTGLSIQTYDFELNIDSPEITNVIRAYDSRLAPTDVHLAVFNGDMSLAGVSPVIRGWIDTINISENNNFASCTVGIVSNIRAGTKALPLMKSHETQLLRDATDNGFKYSAITPNTKILWAAGDGWKNGGFRRS